MDLDSKTFIVHIAIRKQKEMVIDPVRKAQIEVQSGAQNKAQIGVLIFDKAPTEVLAEYSNYNNVFLAENIVELLENTGINKHAITLEEDKQLFFGPIYSLGPVELETLKTYIKINLTDGFIYPSKPPIGALILFDKKPDRSLRLYIDYRGLNNITINNQYLLLLIGELLDWLSRA